MGLNFEKAAFALAKKKNYIKKKIAYKFYKKIVNTTGIKKTFVSGNKEDIISLSLKAAKKIVNDKVKVKRVNIDPAVNKRGLLLSKYKTAIKKYKKKLAEEKSTKSIN